MNKWYDKLDKDKNISVRCFVSNSNKNPLDNEKENGKLVIANIWSRCGDGKNIVYTEIHTGNHWRYAVSCEDIVATFFDEYISNIEDINLCSYGDFLGFMLNKNIDGVFYVQNLEDKYNELIKEYQVQKTKTFIVTVATNRVGSKVELELEVDVDATEEEISKGAMELIMENIEFTWREKQDAE